MDSQAILNHYSISNPFPTEWPAENDESDASDTGPPNAKTRPVEVKPKSRYTVLERSWAERKGLVPGSEKTRDGVENLVQKDEFDALGFAASVVSELRKKGLPVEDDERLRKEASAVRFLC